MDKSNLGNRMKEYERACNVKLTKRLPVIIRLDGNGFSKFTKGFDKPFDKDLRDFMIATCKFLCANIQGCKIAYTQSDEITLVITNYDKIDTSSWFDNKLQKLTSISASMATLAFNNAIADRIEELCNEFGGSERIGLLESKLGKAMFDSRAFVLPKEEVNNCLIWRQNDASKNSISMYAQSMFSHKELMNKNGAIKQEMMFQKTGFNWNNAPTWTKRGTCVVKEKYGLITEKGTTTRTRWVADMEISIFSKDKNYIEQYVFLNKGEN